MKLSLRSSRLLDLGVEYPWRVLVVAGAVVALSIPGLLRLRLETDGRALVPDRAPEVRVDREIRQHFDLRDPIAVVLTRIEEGSIFEPMFLREVEELSRAVTELDGVRTIDVTSLATEIGLRFRPGSLNRARLLDPLPESASDLAELRSDLDRIGVYEGTLVSHDRKAAAVLVGVPDEADRIALAGEIGRLAAHHGERAGARVDVVGAPVAEALLGHHILDDLGAPAGWLFAPQRPASGSRSEAAVGATRSPVAREGAGLVFFALAIMALVFLQIFRRPVAAALPLVEIGASLMIVFGAMGALGVPIYLTTSVLPVILAAVGVADEVHLFRRFVELLEEQRIPGHSRPPAVLVRQLLAELGPAVVRTSSTTAAAFLCFALTPIAAVRSFGLFTAFGVIVLMLWSLWVVPACLTLLPAGWWSPTGRRVRSTAAFEALAAGLGRRRRAVIWTSVLVTVVASIGAFQLVIDDSWLEGFDRRSDFFQASSRFDSEFLGSHLLFAELSAPTVRLSGTVPGDSLGDRELVVPREALPSAASLAGATIELSVVEGPSGDVAVDAADIGSAEPTVDRADARSDRRWRTWIDRVEERDGLLVLEMPLSGGSARFLLRPREGEAVAYEVLRQPFVVPEVLRASASLERFLAERAGVGGVLGPARYLETVAYILEPDTEDSRRLPLTPREASNLWSNYATVRGADRLARLVDEDLERAVVTAYLEGSSYRSTQRLVKELRELARDELVPLGLRLRLGGDVVVSIALVRGAVENQLRSLSLSLIVVALASWWFFGRRSWAVLTVLPPAASVLVGFAIMGFSGIPLGVATSMFAGMTLGIGVDYSIHLLSRVELEQERGAVWEVAIARAVARTGPAILIDALAVGLGFGVLVLSQVPGSARLGLLLALTIIASSVTALLVMPALLHSRPFGGSLAVRGELEPESS